jgi:hypothetical protein
MDNVTDFSALSALNSFEARCVDERKVHTPRELCSAVACHAPWLLTPVCRARVGLYQEAVLGTPRGVLDTPRSVQRHTEECPTLGRDDAPPGGHAPWRRASHLMESAAPTDPRQSLGGPKRSPNRSIERFAKVNSLSLRGNLLLAKDLQESDVDSQEPCERVTRHDATRISFYYTIYE